MTSKGQKYDELVKVVGGVLLAGGVIAFILFVHYDRQKGEKEVNDHAAAWGVRHGAVGMDCDSGDGCMGLNCTATMPDGKLLPLNCTRRGCHLTGKDD